MVTHWQHHKTPSCFNHAIKVHFPSELTVSLLDPQKNKIMVFFLCRWRTGGGLTTNALLLYSHRHNWRGGAVFNLQKYVIISSCTWQAAQNRKTEETQEKSTSFLPNCRCWWKLVTLHEALPPQWTHNTDHTQASIFKLTRQTNTFKGWKYPIPLSQDFFR